MSHRGHRSPYHPSPHGLVFGDLVECLVAGLAEAGLTVPPERLVFACLMALIVRGERVPPDDLLLDADTAALHLAALAAAGSPIVEIRGAGFLSGRRYLVLLDHGGAAIPGDTTRSLVVLNGRGTIGPLSVVAYERLLRWAPRRVVGWAVRHERFTVDAPAGSLWWGPPLEPQGCWLQRPDTGELIEITGLGAPGLRLRHGDRAVEGGRAAGSRRRAA